jgi:hypothetical protein
VFRKESSLTPSKETLVGKYESSAEIYDVVKNFINSYRIEWNNANPYNMENERA